MKKSSSLFVGCFVRKAYLLIALCLVAQATTGFAGWTLRVNSGRATWWWADDELPRWIRPTPDDSAFVVDEDLGNSPSQLVADGTVENLIIGQTSTGVFFQNAHNLTVEASLILGFNAGTFGTFNISGTANFQANTDPTKSVLSPIGNNGTGTVNQTGGSFSAGELVLGAGATANGTYNLNGGLAGTQFLVVGGGGTGALSISNGIFSVNHSATVGLQPGSSGAATLSGSGFLAVTEGLVVGQQSTGTFDMSGGTLHSGSLTVGLGNGGKGTFTLTGGTVTTSGNLILGFGAGSLGTLTLSGGSVDATIGGSDTVFVGNLGTGTLNLNSGSLAASNVNVGFDTGGKGTLNLNGGTLLATGLIGSASGQATSVLNFNGGTLEAATDSSNFLHDFSNGNGSGINVRNGGAIVDTNGHAIAFNNGLNHSTIVGDNAKDGGLMKNGAGTLTLNSVSTFTGNTTVNAGKLELAPGSSVSNSAQSSYVYVSGTAAAAATLSLTGGSVTTSELRLGNTSGMTGNLSVTGGNLNTGLAYIGHTGTGSATQSAGSISTSNAVIGLNGSGSFTQSGGSFTTNANALNVAQNAGSSGTINLSGSGSLTAGPTGIGPRGIGVVNQTGGTFTITSGNQLALGFSSGGQGSYNLDGGTLVAPAVVGFAGASTLNFNGGTLRAGNNASGFVNGLTRANVRNNGAKIDSGGFNVTIAQALLHSNINGDNPLDGGLAKSGAGVLTLSAANTFTGNSSVTAGTLNLANSNALQNSTLTSGGVTFDSGVGSKIFLLGGLSGSGSFALQDNAGAPAAVTLGVGNNNASTTYSGVLSGSGSLNKVGSGMLTLAGANTFTGDLEVIGGTLRFQSSGTVSSSTDITVDSGAVLSFARSDTFGNAASNPTTTITLDGGRAENSGNFFNTLGNLTLNDGAELRAQGGNSATFGAFQLRGTVTAGGTTASSITVNTTFSANNSINLDGIAGATTFNTSTADLTISATLANGFNAVGGGSQVATGLIKTGVETLTLTAANTFTGNTTVSGGTLNLAIGNALQSSTLTTAGITFDSSVLSHVFTLGGLSGGGSFALQDSASAPAAITLNVGNNNTSTTYSGVLSGGGSLTKIGTGTLTLTGANTYTGDTEVSAGILRFQNSGTVAAGSGITVDSGAVLSFARSDTFGNAASNPTATITLDGGRAENSGNFFNTLSNLTLNDGAELRAQGGNSATFGAFQLRGTVAAGGTTASSITANTTFSANNSINLDGIAGATTFNTSTADLTISATLANGFNAVGGGNQVATGLIKTGVETLTLTAANTYTGNTTVSGGTLALTNGSIGASSSTAIFTVNGPAASAATASLSGASTLTVGSAVIGTGATGVFNQGGGSFTSAGTLLVGVNNGGSGTFNLSAGSLTFNGAPNLNGIVVGLNSGSTGLFNQSGGSVDTGNNRIDLGESANAAGTYNLSGGTVTSASLIVGATGNGTYTQAGGTFTIQGLNLVNSPNFLLIARDTGSTGTFNLNGGTFTTSNVSGRDGASTFNFNGGTLRPNLDNTNFITTLARANMRNGGAIIDTAGFNVGTGQVFSHSNVGGDNATDGGLTKNGAGILTLTGASTYTGNTTINAGTLRVGNISGSATGTGAVTVNSGATIGGAGIIAGPLSLAMGATLAPGNSPGRLTLNSNLSLGSGSTFALELGGLTAGSGYDQVFVGGNLSLNNANLSISLVNGFSPALGNKFYFLDLTGGGLVSGLFGNATGSSQNMITDNSGNSYMINYADSYPADGTPSNDISLTVLAVVPEPSTWILLAWLALPFAPGAVRKVKASDPFLRG